VEENGNNKMPGITIDTAAFVTVQGGETVLRFSCEGGLTVTRNRTAFWGLALSRLPPIC
jgi:hypothetical protein